MSEITIPIDETLAHGLATFEISGGSYGVPVRVVREINSQIDMTPVPLAPPFVRGIVNLRGQLVTVVDLGERLELGHREMDDETRLVVLKTNEEIAGLGAEGLETSDDTIGLLVDGIRDVVMPQRNDLEGPPANLPAFLEPLVSGVCKTEDHTITVLEPRVLLDHQFLPTSVHQGTGLENGEAR